MAKIQSPPLLTPVDPAIEFYQRSLLQQARHPVLVEIGEQIFHY